MIDIEYFNQSNKNVIKQEYLNLGYIYIGEKNLIDGDFLTFSLPSEIEKLESIQQPTEFELLQQKVAEQDLLMEELLFEIIPSLIGGM